MDKDVKPFIPALLDDYRLTMAQFRVVCRVARRGECFESVDRIAKGCRMDVKTCKAALKFLVGAGLLTKHPKPGRTTTYRLVSLQFWPASECDQTAPYPNGAGGAKRPASQPNRHPANLARSVPSKGYPAKAVPEGEELPPLRLVEGIAAEFEKTVAISDERLAPSPQVAVFPEDSASVVEHFSGLRRGLPEGVADEMALEWFAKEKAGWRCQLDWRKVSAAWFLENLNRYKG